MNMKKYDLICNISGLIEREKRECFRFYELNPDANGDRKKYADIAIAAYTEILHIVKTA